jgi:mono/diheme cytochrome c family protein
MRTDKIRRMRFRIHVLRLGIVFMAATAGMFAQTVPTDAEYVIPKENPFATAADLQAGEKVFLGQCAGCHGPKGEGRTRRGSGLNTLAPRTR